MSLLDTLIEFQCFMLVLKWHSGVECLFYMAHFRCSCT